MSELCEHGVRHAVLECDDRIRHLDYTTIPTRTSLRTFFLNLFVIQDRSAPAPDLRHREQHTAPAYRRVAAIVTFSHPDGHSRDDPPRLMTIDYICGSLGGGPGIYAYSFRPVRRPGLRPSPRIVPPRHGQNCYNRVTYLDVAAARVAPWRSRAAMWSSFQGRTRATGGRQGL
jgi:hypothetical protein